MRKRLDGLLCALVLRGLDRVDSRVAEDTRDLLRALDTFGRQIGIGIGRFDPFLGVPDEYHSRDRTRESREVSKDDDCAEHGEQHRKNYNCPEFRSGLV